MSLSCRQPTERVHNLFRWTHTSCSGCVRPFGLDRKTLQLGRSLERLARAWDHRSFAVALASCLLAIACAPVAAQDAQSDPTVAAARCDQRIPRNASHRKAFPAGRIFCPLRADPREVTSYVSLLRWHAPWLETRVASVGIGDHVAFVRWNGGGARDGLELALSGALLAQFELEGPSSDFLQSDFLVGLPLTYRSGPTSARLRFYHWSSHLGDEFLLRDPQPVQRREVSVESLEMIVSRELGELRVYGGGEWLLHRVPDALPATVAALGVEASTGSSIFPVGSPVAAWGFGAMHLRWSAVEPGPSMSVRAGLDLGQGARNSGGRSFSVTLEFFEGNSPFGQFFSEPLRWLGVGFRLH